MLLVVGATGRTGRQIVERAAQAGLAVRAFARSAGAASWPAGVEGMGGDVLDPAAVEAAMAGVDAVIVAISMVRASDSPWAKILTPLDLHHRAAELLLAAAERHGVKRYITMSAHGVGDSAPRAGLLFKGLVRSSNVGVAYADLARAEELVRSSALDWTIVRPTRLTNTPGAGRWRDDPALATGSFDRISRADIAAFLVKQVADLKWLRRSVSVTG